MDRHPGAREDCGEAAPEDVPYRALVGTCGDQWFEWSGHVEIAASNQRERSSVGRNPTEVKEYEVEQHYRKRDAPKLSKIAY